MKDDTIVSSSITSCTGQCRLPYTSPKVTVFGDMSELTKANGNAPPTDGEGTVSGHHSP